MAAIFIFAEVKKQVIFNVSGMTKALFDASAIKGT